MKTEWVRNVSEFDGARVDVDPWEVRLRTGYHPLYDYETNDSVAHAEWPESSLRRQVIDALGPEAAVEIDVSVANARTISSLEKRRLADATPAAAWRAIPVEPLTSKPVHGPRIQYGSTFVIGGRDIVWAPGPPTEGWGHLLGTLHLGTVTFAAHSATAFVFAREQTLPIIASVDGRRLEAFDLQAPSLGMQPGAFSTVYVSSVAMVDDQFFLRCHTQAHARERPWP